MPGPTNAESRRAAMLRALIEMVSGLVSSLVFVKALKRDLVMPVTMSVGGGRPASAETSFRRSRIAPMLARHEGHRDHALEPISAHDLPSG